MRAKTVLLALGLIAVMVTAACNSSEQPSQKSATSAHPLRHRLISNRFSSSDRETM
jgi:hypothetical protein